MDEMNNVTMENETSMMENAPVENLVPAEAEGYTSDCGCESNANLDLGKIVKIGVGAVLLIGAGVKYGIPAAKKGFKHIKENGSDPVTVDIQGVIYSVENAEMNPMPPEGKYGFVIL